MHVTIDAYPYVITTGDIEVPDHLNGFEEINEFIQEHWNEINFTIEDVDYCGTDYYIYDENGLEIS